MTVRDLKIILSASWYRSTVDRYCELCGMPIYEGEYCNTYGYVDRREGTKGRMWVCGLCDIDDASGAEGHVQQFLYENRFIIEV